MRPRRRGERGFVGLEPLEPRLLLSFSEVPIGDIGLPSGDHFWGDYNNDGWVDAATYHGIFENNGGTFSHVPGSPAVMDAGQSAMWGDFNNDGWLDIHYNNHGHRPSFLINREGTGAFDLIEMEDLGLSSSRGSALGDFNNDGWLDVYIGGFENWPEPSYPDRLILSRPDPTQPGGRSFEVGWEQSTLLRARGVTAADFNNDQLMDVYVSNYRLQGNLLWINDGSGSDFPFTFGSSSHNALGGHGHSIGSAFGDLNSDGWIDLFAGNFSHPGQPQTAILQNEGPGGDYRFNHQGTAGIYWKESWSSPALADFDNDGMLDVFYTALRSYGNESSLFQNTGNVASPHFSEVGFPASVEGYRASWADWDNDGDMDLHTEGRYFRNDYNLGHSWLKMALRAIDVEGLNGAAIGAVARIRVGDMTVTRAVEAGTGEANANDLTLHFGLGGHSGPVDVEITWPDGLVETVTTDVNRMITVVRGGATEGRLPFLERFNDGEAQSFEEVLGTWQVNAANRYRSDAEVGQKAVSVIHLADALPDHVQFDALVRGKSPSTGQAQNGLLVFDYQDEDNFKYAGGFMGSDQWRIGNVTGGTWQTLATLVEPIDINVDYVLDLDLHANAVTFSVDGIEKISHTFGGSVMGGQLGLGTKNASAVFDDVSVVAIASIPFFEDFSSGRSAEIAEVAGTWDITSGNRYRGRSSVGGNALAFVRTQMPLPSDIMIEAMVRGKNGGNGYNRNALVIFDYQGPANFKYAGMFVNSDEWRIGKLSNGIWTTLATGVPASGNVALNTDYRVAVQISGSDVSLLVDDIVTASHTFGGPLNDGQVGVGTKNAHAAFDDLFIREPAEMSALPYAEDFDDGSADALAVLSGAFDVTGMNRYKATPSVGDDAISIVQLSDALPTTFKISGKIMGKDGGEGYYKNGVLIFDYQSPTDFKYVGAYYGSDTWRIGRVGGGGWQTIKSVNSVMTMNHAYNANIFVDNRTVTLYVDGQEMLSHTFSSSVTDGDVGVGSNRAHVVFDDLSIQETDRVNVLPYAEDFNDRLADSLVEVSGPWTINGGNRYLTTPAADEDAISVIEFTEPLPDSFEYSGILRVKDGGGTHLQSAFLIFDYQSPTDFKFAGANAKGNRWRIGHYDGSEGGAGWQTVVSVAGNIPVNVDKLVKLLVNGSTVTLKVGNTQVASHTFGGAVTGGQLGVASHFSHAVFDNLKARAAATVPYLETFTSSAEALSPVKGDWSVTNGGRLHSLPSLGKNAIATFDLEGAIPEHYKVRSIVRSKSGGAGYYKNASIIFDYQGKNNFKFASLYVNSDEWRIGHFDGSWVFDATVSSSPIDVNVDYSMAVALSGNIAVLSVNGKKKLSYVFDDAVTDGQVGLGTNSAFAAFDNFEVFEISQLVAALPYFETFNDGNASYIESVAGTSWINGGGRYRMNAGLGGNGISVLHTGVLPDNVQVDAIIRGKDGGSGFYKNALVIFDYQGPKNFKWAGFYGGGGGQWKIGRVTAGNWVTEATLAEPLSLETDYSVQVVLEGSTAVLKVDGVEKVQHTFGATVTDGKVGVGTQNAWAAFDDFKVKELEV